MQEYARRRPRMMVRRRTGAMEWLLLAQSGHWRGLIQENRCELFGGLLKGDQNM